MVLPHCAHALLTGFYMCAAEGFTVSVQATKSKWAIEKTVEIRAKQASKLRWNPTRLLLKDPGGGGGHWGRGRYLGPGPAPADPPTHIRKFFLRQKMKLCRIQDEAPTLGLKQGDQTG